jgi:hypothetical protein
MSDFQIQGEVDANHQLKVTVPDAIPPGPVTVVILPVRHEDEGGDAWIHGVAHQWADELSDPRQDIYMLDDGDPVREISLDRG